MRKGAKLRDWRLKNNVLVPGCRGVRLDEVEVLDESSLRSRRDAGEALPGGGG